MGREQERGEGRARRPRAGPGRGPREAAAAGEPAPRRAPRVLLSGVVLGQPPGGVRRHAAELLPRAGKLLARRGGGLSVLEGHTPLPFALPADVRVLSSDVPWRPPLLRALAEGRALAAEAAGAREGGEPFDLIHTGHLPVPPCMPLSYVLTLHDLRALAGEMAPFTRRLVARGVVGRAVRGAARVVTVSETVRAELLARFRLDPEQVAVVPNAADHFVPMPRRAGADAPLVCIGHLEPRKNLELVLRALAHDPELPPLVLAGAAKHGEDERLSALARELGLAGRVELTGAFEEEHLPELLSRAGCVVVPSLIEGFGIVALEAQRARAPLAVAATGALLETAGQDTPAFPPDDPAACAAAIRRALAATEGELASAARRAARFSWDRSAELLVEVWTEVAERARAAPLGP